MHRKLVGLVVGLVCLAGALVNGAAAQPSGATAIPAVGSAERALTAPDLETWLDGYLPYAIKRADIAGAVVVVVKDGAVLLKKGYGVSDVATQQPVDPDRTLFRPGSVSKLITWTAVMQQVEQGRIDLDRDVNDYLDFRIPPAFGRPITMRNLMTHTAGFQDSLRDLLTFDTAPRAFIRRGGYRPIPTTALRSQATSCSGSRANPSTTMSSATY